MVANADIKVQQVSMTNPQQPVAGFTNVIHATKEDCDVIASQFPVFARKLASRVIDNLQTLAGDFGGFPICRLTHSLQSATMARRDGRDDEYVVCALLHDIGDSLGTYNHPEVAAAILRPFVSEANHWMILHHGTVQGYYFFHHYGMDRNMRDALKGSPYYGRTLEFVDKYDVTAFDSAYENDSLDTFIPLIEELFARPKNTQYLYRK